MLAYSELPPFQSQTSKAEWLAISQGHINGHSACRFNFEVVIDMVIKEQHFFCWWLRMMAIDIQCIWSCSCHSNVFRPALNISLGQAHAGVHRPALLGFCSLSCLLGEFCKIGWESREPHSFSIHTPWAAVGPGVRQPNCRNDSSDPFRNMSTIRYKSQISINVAHWALDTIAKQSPLRYGCDSINQSVYIFCATNNWDVTQMLKAPYCHLLNGERWLHFVAVN